METTRTISCFTLLSFLLLVVPVAATDYLITLSTDNDIVNGNCTLREALIAATDNVACDACPAGSEAEEDVITVSNGVTFEGGEHWIGPGSGPLVVQGATGNPVDVLIILGDNRLLRLGSADDTTLRDLTLFSGVAGGSVPDGGVVRAVGTNLTLEAVNIGGSTAENGGAVSFSSIAGDSLLIDGCSFSLNSATVSGGAVAVTATAGGSVTIRDSVFATNTLAGAAASGGGALAVEAANNASVTVERSTFTDSSATITGGGHVFGGAAWIRASDLSSISLSRATFDSNAGAGGGVGYGGALALDLASSSAGELLDCVFMNSSWEWDPGEEALAIVGASVEVDGSSQVLVDRCHFRDNSSANATSESQLWVDLTSSSSATVTNTLIVGGDDWGARLIADTTSQFVAGHLTVTGNEKSLYLYGGSSYSYLTNSVVAGNTFDLIEGGGPILQLNVYKKLNPCFVDAAAGDYRLQAPCSAIDGGDQGNPGMQPFDLDGAPRVFGSETDQGAYEYGSSATSIFADGFESGDTSAWSF